VKCDRQQPACGGCALLGLAGVCVPHVRKARVCRRRRFPEHVLLAKIRKQEALLRGHKIAFAPLHPEPAGGGAGLPARARGVLGVGEESRADFGDVADDVANGVPNGIVNDAPNGIAHDAPNGDGDGDGYGDSDGDDYDDGAGRDDSPVEDMPDAGETPAVPGALNAEYALDP
jgi:hypothetical protein